MRSRRLIVMRHAKSSWKTDAPTDHERPLNKRGRRDAPRVAARLVELGWRPQRILSSDSRRTAETCRAMADSLGDVPVDYLSSFYHGGAEELCWELSVLPVEVETVMAVGHNPGWQEAVAWLSGQWAEMTTANAALLENPAATWAEAASQGGNWTLIDVLRPKELT